MTGQLTDTAKIQKEAMASGFRWNNLQEVVTKCREELEEVEEAFQEGNAVHLREEIGDLMFMSVMICHYIDANPEDVLAEATGKFSKRYAFTKENVDLVSATLEEKLAAWNKAKEVEQAEGL